MKILFCRVGSMLHYEGNSESDTIQGGGSHPNENKHEVYNFQNVDGHCYGYVQPSKGTIRVSRIDKHSKDKVDGVLVIWVAKNRNGGTYIVGWYRDATVYSEFQNSKLKERQKYCYNIETKAENCVLLPADKRTKNVPRAQEQKGFIGQSNVWFADRDNQEVKDYRKEVIDYISKYKEDSGISKRNVQVDVEMRKQVEKAAIKFVTGHYEENGFSVVSKENENLGWDLNATNGRINLRIEVKGLSQNAISVHLTPNELEKMRAKDNADYRLCVVTNALKKPTLITFIHENGEWISEQSNDIRLSFDDQVSAIASVK